MEALRRDPTATATDVELLERLIGRADEEADRPNRKTDRQGARPRIISRTARTLERAEEEVASSR